MRPSYRASSRSGEAAVTPAAALLADPARVAILWALIDGRALPASELARAASVSPSTASSHLARLVAAGWVGAEQHGRHRYMRLVNGDVAGLMEALAAVGGNGGAPAQPRDGSQTDGLRLARSCYNHLAGRAGVLLAEALVVEGALREEGKGYTITTRGRDRLNRLGIDTGLVVAESQMHRRHLARACLDWSERRYHIAGVLGQVLIDRVLALGWFQRRRGTRALALTNQGRRALWREFGVRLV